MLDLRQLHYFVVVVEEGQMTRAAARLHIAQPALSQAVGKLETDLGVRLFERHPRGVTPTEAGTAFYERASRALIAVDEAEEAVEPWLRDGPRLVIGFHEAAGDLARALIRRFMLAHPEVEVETRHLQPADRLVELKRGRVDAEVVYPPPGDAQLVEQLVAISPRYVLVGEKHHLAGERVLTFDQVEHEMLPGRHATVDQRLAEETWLMSRRSAPPRLTAEAPTSLDELWALVSRGKAIAILPLFMISRLQGDGVRAIPLTGVEGIPVVVACLRGDTRPVVRKLRSSLEGLPLEAVGEMRGEGPEGGPINARSAAGQAHRRDRDGAPAGRLR
jgi:DNA-binding transcriptional LysR family regulator